MNQSLWKSTYIKDSLHNLSGWETLIILIGQLQYVPLHAFILKWVFHSKVKSLIKLGKLDAPVQ